MNGIPSVIGSTSAPSECTNTISSALWLPNHRHRRGVSRSRRRVPLHAVAIFMGWILGKALETRGVFWAWWIHFLSDLVIFVFIALTLVP